MSNNNFRISTQTTYRASFIRHIPSSYYLLKLIIKNNHFITYSATKGRKTEFLKPGIIENQTPVHASNNLVINFFKGSI